MESPPPRPCIIGPNISIDDDDDDDFYIKYCNIA